MIGSRQVAPVRDIAKDEVAQLIAHDLDESDRSGRSTRMGEITGVSMEGPLRPGQVYYSDFLGGRLAGYLALILSGHEDRR